MRYAATAIGLFVSALLIPAAPPSYAQTLPLVAVGTLDQSRAGSFADL